MDENLITKKELLEQFGISYGALYRWKRKNLIPDEWFIRRATYTGQETFFPREKIIPRVEKIMELKENLSLDEIAETFSPSAMEVSFTASDMVLQNIVPQAAVDLYLARFGESGPYDFEGLFSIYLFSKLLGSGQIGQEDAYQAISLYKSENVRVAVPRLAFFRKLGVCTVLLTTESAELISEEGAAFILDLSIQQLNAELKERLGKPGAN